ncbi:hypothetical protein [Malaciobacter canalis]|uniref:hypothetical protein n=1 Tax=Malaciobacter canalis TaxID=1912871 RepID=UPI00384B1E8A
MKGKILDYNIQESKGIISGDDNQRYEFVNSEWKGDKPPAKNQIVDFEIDGKMAKAIYLESSQFLDSNDMKEKISQINNSEAFKSAQSQIKGTLKDGIQNKFGFILSILFGIALFLPIIKIPFVGTGSLIDGGLGKICLFLVIVLAIMFYSGVKHLFVKIVSGIILFIILIQFYDLFTGLYDGGQALSAFGGGRRSVNLFSLLQFGTYIILPLSIILFFTSFKKAYTEKIHD